MHSNGEGASEKSDTAAVPIPEGFVACPLLEGIPVEHAERLRLMLRQKGMTTTATAFDTCALLTAVLLQPEVLLAQQMDLSLDDVNALYGHVSAALLRQSDFLASPTSVASVLSCRHRHFISTGQQGLDGALRGGVGCGLITEVTGAAGAGKTALALSLAMHAATHPKTDGRRVRTLWITTDLSAFPAAVAAEVLQWHLDARSCSGDEGGENVGNVLCNVAVTICPTLAQLREYLPALRGHVARQTDLRLVVIDNFTVLVRRSFPGVENEVKERHEAVAELMSVLKSLAQEFCVAVVIATASGDELGHSFLHSVNTRLRLSQCLLEPRDALGVQGEIQPRVTRVLQLVKSSAAAGCCFECEFDGMRLTRAQPLDEDAVLLFEDAAMFGVDPLGHVKLPTFVYC
ncbi:DNA repair protein [Trypanosoma rangeli]|uniref:DNA repair protein n=1 Tax=Trypanosoma rangeli TaxID=5698 RepID=A0A3R7P0B3_TRYRA|nr:DNA repair protein [Trypanosoma rangeli]RNF10631.1 DNA repair protein [Trypanosoma rangeli]|eukprot:RNF10631.1 DNA repair protein [Trypanosoma rangeli]